VPTAEWWAVPTLHALEAQPELLNVPARTKWSADVTAILISVVVFAALSIYESFRSPGFLEADACTHYLYARFALREPHYLLNVWGRPLVTGLYAIPAYLGERLGVHLMSLAMALVCAAVAYFVARGQKYRYPALAVIFTLAQPLVFLHSFSELTELPFAAVIGLAFLAYQRRRFLLMSLLVGLSPLARPEGFGFLILALIALIAQRRWWWIPILALPLLAWDYCGWLAFGKPSYPEAAHLPGFLAFLPWLKHTWPYASESIYGRGSIFQYVWFLPAIVSPLVLPATLFGIGHGVSKIDRSSRDHTARCDALIAFVPLFILIAHSLLTFLGKMASSGEVRYMLVVAPFWGLLSASGWEFIWQHMNWKWPLRIAGVAVLLPVIVNEKPYFLGRAWGYRVLPMNYTDDMLQAKRLADWYRAWPGRAQYPHVLTNHTGIHFFLDISPTAKDATRQWTKQTIALTPPGTVLVWDPVYGYYNSDENRSVTVEEVDAAGWILDLPATRMINQLTPDQLPDKKMWSVWLSPKREDGEATPVDGSVVDLATQASTALTPLPL
jgi:hypothetical protein